MRYELQFKRMVTAQVVTGIVAFCMAENNPGLLLVAGAVALLSWFVTEGPTGRFLPKWGSNLGAMTAVALLLVELQIKNVPVIIAMGHFTMALQVLMLYTRKGSREYAQVMVLSLLQMIGASVLSLSMVYGAVLAGYCMLAMVTVLLFQLKGASDQVYEENRRGAPSTALVRRPQAVAGRGHRWHFRFEALVIALVCGTMAVAVFVVLPRRAETRFDAVLAGTSLARERVGFSQSVSMTSSMNAQSSREPVLNMVVRLDGRNIGQEGLVWLLRGAALDRYDSSKQVWRRSTTAAGYDHMREMGEGISLIDIQPDQLVYEADITLRQSTDRTLFAVQPLTYVNSQNLPQIRFNPVDQKIEAVDVSTGAIIYRIRWAAQPVGDYLERYRVASQTPNRWQPPIRHRETPLDHYAHGWRSNRASIQQLTREVLISSGLQVPEAAEGEELQLEPDMRIPAAIERYLRQNFSYTLDNPAVEPPKDAVHVFLIERRQGHCELFAAGMAAMVRSAGLQARVVTGYRASEYNRLGGYYVVRHSNAHAWTEVYCGPKLGWRAFDATPPDDVAREHLIERSLFSLVRELYEFVEWRWIKSVVAYDQQTRDAVIAGMKDSVTSISQDHESIVGKVVQFFVDLPQTWRLARVSYTIAGVLIVLILLAVASLVRTMIVRRRRLQALQLSALPRARRRGLAKKLRFYLTMLEMLERKGYARAEWQSPFGFAKELIAQDPNRFQSVLKLTEVFYEIRFGHRNMDQDRRDQVRDLLSTLERSLSVR